MGACEVHMTTEERREANRLRSERWRRAHGIPVRKPASKPWLAEGCSRSTWYRRGNRIGGQLLAEREKAKGAQGTGSNQYQKVLPRHDEGTPKTLEQMGVSESLCRAEFLHPAAATRANGVRRFHDRCGVDFARISLLKYWKKAIELPVKIMG